VKRELWLSVPIETSDRKLFVSPYKPSEGFQTVVTSCGMAAVVFMRAFNTRRSCNGSFEKLVRPRQ
jgi:hypothetical protein